MIGFSHSLPQGLRNLTIKRDGGAIGGRGEGREYRASQICRGSFAGEDASEGHILLNVAHQNQNVFHARGDFSAFRENVYALGCKISL